jgi:serine/threonine protein kinase
VTDSDQLTRAALTRVGTRLKDKWSLLRLLGVGGSAAVYEAEHRNGRRVAIKMLHAKYSAEHSAQRRFLQEAYAANRVQHPDVVQVYDDGVDENGNVFLVSELLEGRSLAELQAERGGPLPPATAVNLVCAALEPLAAAHAKGVVHRDLKPGNLFLCDSGALKLLDFGIARIAEAPTGGSMQTATGAWFGTPAFVAPEQARGRWSDVDERSDIWAIGATLFTLLSGQFVFRAETLNEQLGLAMTTPARSLGSVGDFPSGLVSVVDRALAFEQSERFPNAASMLDALRALQTVLDDEPVSVQTLGSRRAPGRSARHLARWGLALGAALGVLGFYWMRSVATQASVQATTETSVLRVPAPVPSTSRPVAALPPIEVPSPSPSSVALVRVPLRPASSVGKVRQPLAKAAPSSTPRGNPLDIRD